MQQAGLAMDKGLYLSAEALISLIVLSTLLAVPLLPKSESLTDLHVFQKENDLLRVWATTGIPDGAEIASDFEFVFPSAAGFVEINGNRVVQRGGCTGEIVSSTAYLLDESLEEKKITVGICT